MIGTAVSTLPNMLLDPRTDLTEQPPESPFPGVAPAPRPWSTELRLRPGSDLWVFGYGSLMWDPGFPSAEHHPAVLKGYHRRFCVSSHRYRGTPENPGLVLGLDRGGTCRGIAFRVVPPHVEETLDYLWDREMISRVYRPKLVPVRMQGGRTVSACTFVVDRAHGQYCGCLDEAAIAERIAACSGERGRNLDYLANTVAHLDGMGVHDRNLSGLLTAVRRRLAPSPDPA